MAKEMENAWNSNWPVASTQSLLATGALVVVVGLVTTAE